MNFDKNDFEQVFLIVKELIKEYDFDIDRNNLELSYDNMLDDYKTKHSKNSHVLLVYNFLYILSKGKVGLSGYSAQLYSFLEEKLEDFSATDLYDVAFSDDGGILFDKISENEEELMRSEKDIDYNFNLLKNRITTRLWNISCKEIFDKWNDKNLILDPIYQRFFVWKQKKQSNFIESIFMQIPIPQVYSYEKADFSLEIIDGKQRIMTICSYLKNEFALSDDMDFKELSGKKFSDLDDLKQKYLLNFPISFLVIPNSINYKYVYIIFNRLNINAMVLKHQEIRNSIFSSRMNDEVKKFASGNELFNEYMPSSKSNRMENIESIYRFLSIKQKCIFVKKSKLIELNNHSGVAASIDEYMKKMKDDDHVDHIKIEIDSIITSLQLATNIFSEKYAFKLYEYDKEKFKNRINRPLFDVVMICCWFYKDYSNSLIKNKEKIVKDFKELCNPLGNDFIDSFSSATGNKNSINLKLYSLSKILGKYSDV